MLAGLLYACVVPMGPTTIRPLQLSIVSALTPGLTNAEKGCRLRSAYEMPSGSTHMK